MKSIANNKTENSIVCTIYWCNNRNAFVHVKIHGLLLILNDIEIK